uniref:Troponin I, fast skeletal muscle n=1 Tax=Oryzias sinensis TaxID=183150 RepID=A0A8C7Y013_9TELE
SLRKKMSSSRKHQLKSLMLSIAKGILEEEDREREEEREKYMAECCPPLAMPRTLQELQELCREIHHKIDVTDEERYDLEAKVNKANKEIIIFFSLIDLFVLTILNGKCCILIQRFSTFLEGPKHFTVTVPFTHSHNDGSSGANL